MIITVTERAEFKRCRRRWFYSSPNGLRLTRIAPSTALALGDLVHKTLAQWLVEPDTELGHQFMLYASEALETAKEVYHKQVGCYPNTNELAGLLDGITLGKAMMENYQTFWKTPLPEGFTLIAPEQKIEQPIPGGHFLEMKLDGLIAKGNNIYVLEHKTYSSRPNRETLDANDQFLGYIWGADRLGLGNVIGLAYDGMWKRVVPPKGSVMSDLFTRTFLIRPQEELLEFAFFLTQEAEEMAAIATNAQGAKQLYINRRWEGCYDCGFDPLCRAESRGEDFEHVRNTLYTTKRDE